MKIRLLIFSLSSVLLWIGPFTAHAAGSLYGLSSTLTVGVPHPINLAIDQRLGGGRFSVGLAGGTLRVPIDTQITAGISNIEARGRWHPFSGVFFLGTILGLQSMNGTAKQTIPVTAGVSVPTTIDLTLKNLFITPHLGWFGYFSSGFTLGFEIGLQVPFSASTTLGISIDDPTLNEYLNLVQTTSQYQTMDQQIQDAGNQLSKQLIPYVTVLRIGWTF